MVRVRRDGIPFKKGLSEGFKYGGKRYVTHIWRPFERGEHYQPSNCDCGIPPWEACSHSIY